MNKHENSAYRRKSKAMQINRCSQINQLILVIQAVTNNEFMTNTEFTLRQRQLYCIYNGKGFTVKLGVSKPPYKVLDCGGTMWRLIQDFAVWIRTGNFSNHMHGNGGLYGYRRWNNNYTKHQMEPMFEYAKKIGYLYTNDEQNFEESKKF